MSAAGAEGSRETPSRGPSAARPYALELEVRGYELDVWSHVNHAVYTQWLEHGRWKLMMAHDLMHVFDAVRTVVRKAEYEYLGESLVGDVVRINTWVGALGTTSFRLDQSIEIVASADGGRAGGVVTRSSVTLVCVEPGKGKVPVPEPLRGYLEAALAGVDRVPASGR